MKNTFYLLLSRAWLFKLYIRTRIKTEITRKGIRSNCWALVHSRRRMRAVFVCPEGLFWPKMKAVITTTTNSDAADNDQKNRIRQKDRENHRKQTKCIYKTNIISVCCVILFFFFCCCLSTCLFHCFLFLCSDWLLLLTLRCMSHRSTVVRIGRFCMWIISNYTTHEHTNTRKRSTQSYAEKKKQNKNIFEDISQLAECHQGIANLVSTVFSSRSNVLFLLYLSSRACYSISSDFTSTSFHFATYTMYRHRAKHTRSIRPITIDADVVVLHGKI